MLFHLIAAILCIASSVASGVLATHPLLKFHRTRHIIIAILMAMIAAGNLYMVTVSR